MQTLVCDKQGNIKKVIYENKHFNNTVKKQSELVYLATSYKASPKKHFLTKNERKFYYILRHAIPEDTVLLIKPRLIDFVNHCEKQDGHYSVLAMHVDFMLLKIPQMIAILAIELDDSSHNDRFNVDKLKNAVLEENGIPLLRIKLSNYYPKDKLRQVILDTIKTSRLS